MLIAQRRPRLLIVGCGDIGLRVAALALPRWRVLALTSSPQRVAVLRAAGIVPIQGNLDIPHTLSRVARLAPDAVLMLAPPSDGNPASDSRSRHLLDSLRPVRMLATGAKPALRAVYVGTSGVYGDCGGACVAETRPCAAQTPRARRRCDAERQWREAGRRNGWQVSLLRVPGIYDGSSRSPRARIERGVPVLRTEDDVFTSHIHADDLARLCMMALMRGKPGRVYNVADRTELRMGDYFDLAADLYGLPRPPRVARSAAGAAGLGPMSLSFMSESRRLDTTRMENELGLRLRYADVTAGLRAAG